MNVIPGGQPGGGGGWSVCCSGVTRRREDTLDRVRSMAHANRVTTDGAYTGRALTVVAATSAVDVVTRVARVVYSRVERGQGRLL